MPFGRKRYKPAFAVSARLLELVEEIAARGVMDQGPPAEVRRMQVWVGALAAPPRLLL